MEGERLLGHGRRATRQGAGHGDRGGVGAGRGRDERVANPNAARIAYGALLRRWPESLNGAVGLANVHYAHADLQAAESVLRNAVQHHPTSSVALNNLAQVVADQGRNEEALALIDSAVALGGPFASAAEATRTHIRRKLSAPQ